MRASDLFDLDIICVTSGDCLYDLDPEVISNDVDLFYRDGDDIKRVRLEHSLGIIRSIYAHRLGVCQLNFMHCFDQEVLSSLWARSTGYDRISPQEFYSCAHKYIMHQNFCRREDAEDTMAAYCDAQKLTYCASVDQVRDSLERIISPDQSILDLPRILGLELDPVAVYESVALFCKKNDRMMRITSTDDPYDVSINPLTECDLVFKNKDGSYAVIELKQIGKNSHRSGKKRRQLSRAHHFFNYNFDVVPQLFALSYRECSSCLEVNITEYAGEDCNFEALVNWERVLDFV